MLMLWAIIWATSNQYNRYIYATLVLSCPSAATCFVGMAEWYGYVSSLSSLRNTKLGKTVFIPDGISYFQRPLIAISLS